MTAIARWAKSVKERDKKCVECGTEEDLHAHHIKPKASNPEKALDITNGKTLCYRCHKKEHEKNRPIRVRSDNPRKATLHALLLHLRKENIRLEDENKRIKQKMKALIKLKKLPRVLNPNTWIAAKVKKIISACG